MSLSKSWDLREKWRYRGIRSFLCSIPMGIGALSDALGSEAYVHLVTFRVEDAINERCICASTGF